MTLKNKISLLISLVFSVLFFIASTIVYISFADFRKDEFETRLKEKANVSLKLLLEVKEIDRQLLKIIDQNSINKLYDEKTLLFDSEFNLIYSSLDDAKIDWDIDDLKYLKAHKTFFKKVGEYEVYGIFYDTNEKDYYALISASDDAGKRKSEFLVFILLATYIVFTAICWFVTSYVVRKLLAPLDVFHAKIKSINENNLDTQIEVKNKKDEIDLLANEFNQMMRRIDISYQKQKEFTAHASHELRTPISRITSQIENRIFDTETDISSQIFLKKILTDINQISELISSLLLLSRIENTGNDKISLNRIDELIYETIEKVNKQFPDFRASINIENTENIDEFLEVKGNKSLLEIAFLNLFKNAYFYGNDKQARINISTSVDELIISIINNGKTLNDEEQLRIFQPFMRGKNSNKNSGLGLGLRIVQRIINQSHAQIYYQAINGNSNVFIIKFKH